MRRFKDRKGQDHVQKERYVQRKLLQKRRDSSVRMPMLQKFVESMHKAVQANKLVENAVPIAKQGLKNAHAILKEAEMDESYILLR